MNKHWFSWLEIAPTKTFDEFLNISEIERRSFLNHIKNHNILPVAMQSLLYWKPELQLFDNAWRILLFNYLVKIIEFSNDFWIKSLIFGSPKNRIYQNMTKDEATKVAIDFFRKIWTIASDKWVFICIEPNPQIYWWNFMCNTIETLDFVKEINNPWIKLHLDLWTIIANNEDIKWISQAKDYITHFHISEPNLEVIKERKEHKKMVALLIWYDWYCSIEMKRTTIENIEKTLILISNLYK